MKMLSHIEETNLLLMEEHLRIFQRLAAEIGFHPGDTLNVGGLAADLMATLKADRRWKEMPARATVALSDPAAF